MPDPRENSCRLNVDDRQEDLPINPTGLAALVQAVLKGENSRADELYLHFITEEEICRLHAEYFQDPSPTDCISFPIDRPDEPYCVLGEILVCPKTAINYVTENGGEPYQEVALYVVHGLLHLLGYDDLSIHDENAMRAREAFYSEAICRCAVSMSEGG